MRNVGNGVLSSVEETNIFSSAVTSTNCIVDTQLWKQRGTSGSLQKEYGIHRFNPMLNCFFYTSGVAKAPPVALALSFP